MRHAGAAREARDRAEKPGAFRGGALDVLCHEPPSTAVGIEGGGKEHRPPSEAVSLAQLLGARTAW